MSEQSSKITTLSWPVENNGDTLGIVKAYAFEDSSEVKGMKAQFEATIPGTNNLTPIAEAARILGAHHFNWYQIIVDENNSILDWVGFPIEKTPFIDPPAYGYGPSSPDSDDAMWCDRRPWYIDETLPPRDPLTGKFMYKYDPSWGYLGCVTTKTTVFFEDEPAFLENGHVKFHTWLVSVHEDGRLNNWHGGFTWESISTSASTGYIKGPEALNRPPTTAEYEDLINIAPWSWHYEKVSYDCPGE